MTNLSTRSRLAKSCERGFEALIERLFDHPRIVPGTKALAEVPVIGGVYIVGEEHYMRSFVPKIAAALVARERFREDWAGELPVHEDLCMRMQHDGCPRAALLGYYGYSLLEQAYDYDAHPKLDTYISGLMAHPHTPVRIRNDCELKAEFPPQELEWLTDEFMLWRTEEQFASYRDMRARNAAFEAERATEGW
jgi:hypothetical protein